MDMEHEGETGAGAGKVHTADALHWVLPRGDYAASAADASNDGTSRHVPDGGVPVRLALEAAGNDAFSNDAPESIYIPPVGQGPAALPDSSLSCTGAVPADVTGLLSPGVVMPDPLQDWLYAGTTANDSTQPTSMTDWLDDFGGYPVVSIDFLNALLPLAEDNRAL